MFLYIEHKPSSGFLPSQHSPMVFKGHRHVRKTVVELVAAIPTGKRARAGGGILQTCFLGLMLLLLHILTCKA